MAAALFSILSIDLAPLFLDGSEGSTTFTGSLSGGGTVSSTFDFPGASAMAPAFTTFAFGSGWSTVTGVSWTQSGNFFTGEQFDNIALDVAVTPEPASLVLFATGLVGLALARRRIGALHVPRRTRLVAGRSNPTTPRSGRDCRTP